MSASARRGRPPVPHATHRKLADTLRQRIIKGEWTPGAVIPSIRTLAAEFSAGRRAVGLAIDKLKEEGRLGLTPQRRLVVRAGEVSYGMAGQLVLFVIGDPLQHMTNDLVFQGVLAGCGELKAPVAIAHDARLRDHLPDELLALPLRGVLIYGQVKIPTLKRYQKLGIPVVIVDRPVDDVKLHVVAVDNRPSFSDAVRRLVKLGHKRIALVRYVSMGLLDIDADSKERQQGFSAAMREAGLDYKSAIFNSFSSELDESLGVKALLDARPRFTAVLCVDPPKAALVEKMAKARGLKIPKDLSLVMMQAKTSSGMRISGPCVDFMQLGKVAVHLLKQPARPAQRVRVAAEWFEGETIGPPS